MGQDSKLKPECIRRVANWSHIAPQHKFDKPHFSPEAVIQDLQKASPKMTALLQNIQDLDANDMEKHGKYFKHFIFSDVKQGGYGSKIITSTMIANGCTLAYNNKLELHDDKDLLKSKGRNVALLCSTSIFDKPITVKAKKSIFSKFNSRPDNVHGELIRFIVMDSGFKEGIDLFDVKYVHIFEPQTSKADQKQVIGRGTRTCGQKGLEFHPTRGWPLNVFVYDVSVPKELHNKLGADSLFKSYMVHSGIDLRRIAFADELERMSIIGSVDYELNKNIHRFKVEDDFELPALFGGDIPTPDGEVKCNKNCGRMRPTKDVPVSMAQLITAFLALGRSFPKTLKTDKTPRVFFCDILKKDKEYCSSVRAIHNDPHAFVTQKKKVLIDAIEKRYHRSLPTSPRVSFLRFVFSIIPRPVKLKAVLEEEFKSVQGTPMNATPHPKTPEEDLLTPPAPLKRLNFIQTREFIREHFTQYTWPKVKLENMCGGMQAGANILNFSPTQDFVRNYFTVENPQKGMLLWHSVGVGKTCSAIATASDSFERAGYTILWVTRTTLKSDIWKNMFEQVCSIPLQNKLKEGFTMPADSAERMKLLSSSWSIRPMSYKQFSNLVAGKNDFYKALVKRNGEEDPLRKTLLIIDEAHKLYGGTDLSSVERPDMNKFHAAIMNSYEKSGKDSVRLLMMTATPFTNDPMELIQLINLVREKNEQMHVDYETFSNTYLNNDGVFSKKGSRLFLDDIAGTISYLNRERDARQFAQPSIVPVHVDMSTLPDVSLDEIKSDHVENLSHLKGEMEDLKQGLKEAKADSKEKLRSLKDTCKGLKKEVRKNCLEKLEEEKASIHADLEVHKETFEIFSQQLKETVKEAKKAYKEKVEQIKKDPSQQNIIDTKCISTAKKSKSVKSTPNTSESDVEEL